MYDKKGILYCEKPKCKPECPVDISASCIPNNYSNDNENVNNPNKNICSCYNGWKGQYCETKINIDFSNFFITYTDYLGNVLNFLIKHIGISLLLIIYYIYNSLGYELGISGKNDSKFKITSTFKSNDGLPTVNSSDISVSTNSHSIISQTNIPMKKMNKRMSSRTKDSYRQSIISIKQNNYVMIPDYQEIRKTSKKESIIKLNINNNNININDNKDDVIYEDINESSTDNLIQYPTSPLSPVNYGFDAYNNPDYDKKIQHNEYNYGLQINTNSTNQNKILHKNSYSCDSPDNNENITNITNDLSFNVIKKYINLKKAIKKAQSTFIEVHIIYPIYILITLLVSILIIDGEKERESKNLNIVQSKNGEWMYKCNSTNIEILYSFLEFFILLIILKNGITILKYECVFKCTKYITYSSIIGIALGPLINIITISFLEDQRYEQIIFEIILNSICYLTFFLLFSWNKVYYIIRNKDIDSHLYFKYVKHDMCMIHNSYTCACEFDDSNENNHQVIKNYIIFYKICSKILEITDGKIKYINVKSKMNIINNLYSNNTE
ncbi:hypothetical protein PIROE2DRAFT_14574 [Piromyces sp. E2]|nr:hypothetical protein PIROE2DRAFT_14574 [Piromyces sp. E2]|eukprot:OUM59806.1 hypothetical protein PIROE2DRAFT_14574 [Piromyces sp. E2]